MRVIALLGWYDENPEWLWECVLSLPKAGVSHLVCCDGAYESFPGGKRRSSRAEHQAIREVAKKVGITVEVHTPPARWTNEVAKRNFLFRKAERIATEQDWYLVIDGDELVKEADLSALATTDYPVAAGTLEEPMPDRPTTRSPMRRLYKAIRGIHVKGSHDCYVLPDGRVLWGIQDRVDALDLQDKFVLLHRTHYRDEQRRKAAKDFYRVRSELKTEAHPCGVCGGVAHAEAPFDFHLLDWEGRTITQPTKDMLRNGLGRLSARSMWACEKHKRDLDQDAKRVFIHYGFDPARARGERQNVG